MVEREGPHFTTPLFLAMHGHDLSVANPADPDIIADARKLLKDRFTIEQSDLESYWDELEKLLDYDKLPVLRGERRAYLKGRDVDVSFSGHDQRSNISYNLALAKAFYLSRDGDVYLQFRMEALNIFNIRGYGNYDSTVGSINFGYITTAGNSPRAIQMAARLAF